MSQEDARQISGWRYDGPWQIYDPDPQDEPMDHAEGYRAVAGADGGALIGFCCAGVEARVPGLEEDPDLIDVGLGMDPAWVGSGHGAAFGQAVLDHFRAEPGVTGLRAAVQSWNERSLRLIRRLGFAEESRHSCVQGGRVVEYVVVVAR